MRSSNKLRSRNKNNNRRYNSGNILNRVFNSSGPNGKVRGTPQQIVDKYQSFAQDSLLSGDRVAYENFLQYAEHYLRILKNTQREINNRKENQNNQHKQQNTKTLSTTLKSKMNPQSCSKSLFSTRPSENDLL